VSTRLRSRLVWKQKTAAPVTPAAKGQRSLTKAARDADTATEQPDFDMPVTPHERAVMLLHIGSEIEHALMVQYLYAAYSLNENQATEERSKLVRQWRSVVAEIAREEMGHLATVQNILTLIGGPLCFDRDDFPLVDDDLWPFPFELEQLTRDSVGKYVLAEAPSDEVLTKLGLLKEIEQIKRRLKCDQKLRVNRVGKIYGDILKLFTEGPMVQGPIVGKAPKPYPFVAAADIQADSLPYQVSPGAWGLGYKQILIDTAHDRKTALAALQRVSVQGEGPIEPTDAKLRDKVTSSHFYRFLEIYRQFPEQSDWSPARPVAANPTTNQYIEDPDRRIQGEAEKWAFLANLRYRMLLLYLEHSFCIETPTTHPTHSPRAALVSWTFGEMYNIRSLSEILMSLPLQPSSDKLAGPPFEMPYTLSLPSRDVNRWRTHRDLLLAAIELIDDMLVPGATHGTHGRYLTALRAADRTSLDQINVLIGA
jgi:hypothetical protein